MSNFINKFNDDKIFENILSSFELDLDNNDDDAYWQLKQYLGSVTGMLTELLLDTTYSTPRAFLFWDTEDNYHRYGDGSVGTAINAVPKVIYLDTEEQRLIKELQKQWKEYEGR